MRHAKHASSGRGMLTGLLQFIGCAIYGLDIVCPTHSHKEDIGMFYQAKKKAVFPEVGAMYLHECNNVDIIPADHILLISWGPNTDEMDSYHLNEGLGSPIDIMRGKTRTGMIPYLHSYLNRGGKCVIIIGEEDIGCTTPTASYFVGRSDWKVSIRTIPNFYENSTFMSVNIKII